MLGQSVDWRQETTNLRISVESSKTSFCFNVQARPSFYSSDMVANLSSTLQGERMESVQMSMHQALAHGLLPKCSVSSIS